MVCIRIGTHIVSMLLGKAITSDVLLVISNLVGSYSCKNQIQINILTHLDGITGDILDSKQTQSTTFNRTKSCSKLCKERDINANYHY